MYYDWITLLEAITPARYGIVAAIVAAALVIGLVVVRAQASRPVHLAPAPEPVSAQPQALAPTAQDSSSIDAVLVAAAIAAYLGCGTDGFVVRSIRRVQAPASTWEKYSRLKALR